MSGHLPSLSMAEPLAPASVSAAMLRYLPLSPFLGAFILLACAKPDPVADNAVAPSDELLVMHRQPGSPRRPMPPRPKRRSRRRCRPRLADLAGRWAGEPRCNVRTRRDAGLLDPVSNSARDQPAGLHPLHDAERRRQRDVELYRQWAGRVGPDRGGHAIPMASAANGARPSISATLRATWPRPSTARERSTSRSAECRRWSSRPRGSRAGCSPNALAARLRLEAEPKPDLGRGLLALLLAHRPRARDVEVDAGQDRRIKPARRSGHTPSSMRLRTRSC